jgi:KaiC/GvpD/RAD55 family RecA-like ATPase
MVSEQSILAACLDNRLCCDKVVEHVDRKSLSDKAWIILEEIKDYYIKDSRVSSADKTIILDRLIRNKPKHTELWQSVLGSLPEAISAENITTEVLELKKRVLKDRLSGAFAQTGNDKELDKLLTEYTSLCTTEEATNAASYQNVDLTTLVSQQAAGTIKIWPEELNNALGGNVGKKKHLLLFARPDLGKTLFSIAFIYSGLRQNLKVLYCSNEDDPTTTVLRVAARMCEKSVEWVKANPEEANTILAKRHWDKFIFEELQPGNKSDLTALTEKHRPDILIVDQIRNLEMGSDHKVIELETAAKFVRNLGKKYNMLVVSVTQAGESAEGKRMLTRNDVDGSKTGIPGACDVMLGVGASFEDEAQGIRYLSFPKNKLGPKETIRVSIDPFMSKIV